MSCDNKYHPAILYIFFLYPRVWDKVISGSCKILVFVGLEILLNYKIILMGTSRPEAVVKFLCNVSLHGHTHLCDCCHL